MCNIDAVKASPTWATIVDRPSNLLPRPLVYIGNDDVATEHSGQQG
jgi:hypothetical protein